MSDSKEISGLSGKLELRTSKSPYVSSSSQKETKGPPTVSERQGQPILGFREQICCLL